MQRLYLGAYGAKSLKPLHIWANTASVGQLARSMAAAQSRLKDQTKQVNARVYYDAQGRKRCHGTDQLKSTQSVPEVCILNAMDSNM